MKLVTAVITTHKRHPDMVERALKSIINQTYKNIEIIVVDDSPAEYENRNQVKAMVEGYSDANVTYIAHEKCMGACVARNTALANAKGEYIAYLDDDDEWKPEKIEVQLTGFVNENVGLVYCNNEIINDTTGEVRQVRAARHVGMVYDKLMMKNFIGSTSFPLIKTSYLREIGGFDVLMQSSQDYDVWLRLSKKYEVNYVNEALIIYHVHAGEQISRNPIKKINGKERIDQKNMDYLLKNKVAYWNRLIMLAPYYGLNKQPIKAVGIWFKAVAKRPMAFKENCLGFYRIFASLAIGLRR